MNIPTIRIKFDRKKKASSSIKGKGVLEFEMYYEGRRKYISTGLSVHPHEWDGNRIIRHPDSYIMNKLLNDKHDELRKRINQILMTGEKFSFGALEARMSTYDLKGNFIDYVEDKITTRTDIEDNTRRTHRKLINILKANDNIRSFSDITPTNIKSFDRFLHERYTNNSTIYSYHKHLKTYINIALREGLLESNPYSRVKIKRGKDEPVIRYLKEEEIRMIEELNVEDYSVMRARDLFLFQCYTGLAYSDMIRINFEQIKPENGKYIIHKDRKKTGVSFHIVLLAPALRILERYRFKLPIISIQKYNIALKTVAAHAGLRFNLTSHCGRHTFATWSLNKGISIETLKVMLGHSDINTTSIYAKIINKTVEDAFEKLEAVIK